MGVEGGPEGLDQRTAPERVVRRLSCAPPVR